MRKSRWLLLLLLCAACRITPHGEWNAAECSNHLDDDGDHLIDCEDPDCWAFVCSDAAVNPAATSSDAGPDTNDTTPIATEPPRDAAPPPAVTPPRPDATQPISSADDAGPELTCSETPSLCDPGESCVGGVCKPEPLGNYTLQVTSAVVPATNRAGTCYDADERLCALFLCDNECQPDPYVVVRKSVRTLVGMTVPRPDTERPVWTDPGWPLTLNQQDTLEFTAWDHDAIASSKIFACTPDLRQLPTGTLRCSPAAMTTIDPPTGTVFEIVAHVVKLP
jgi:hypothetical protein